MGYQSIESQLAGPGYKLIRVNGEKILFVRSTSLKSDVQGPKKPGWYVGEWWDMPVPLADFIRRYNSIEVLKTAGWQNTDIEFLEGSLKCREKESGQEFEVRMDDFKAFMYAFVQMEKLTQSWNSPEKSAEDFAEEVQWLVKRRNLKNED